jgi:urease accessory protein
MPPAARAVKTVVVVALSIGLTGPAWAHSPIEGMSSFYGGVLHPMLVPAHLVVLLALGLLLGTQAERPARIGAAAWLLALVIGLLVLTGSAGLTTTPALLAGAAVLGALVAAGWRLPTWLLWPLALAVGLGLALDSDPELAETQDRLLALAGTALGAVLVAAAGMLIADYGLQRGWQRIAVRVLGSWIAASAIMVSALGLVTAAESGSSALAASPSDFAPATLPPLSTELTR